MKRNAKGQFVSDKKSETPPEEKVYAAGFKGFGPGMVCRGMQFREGEVFEVEGEAVPCENGIHFCEHPLNVFYYYPPVSNNGKMNEFATVESLAEPKTEDNRKFCTTKIRIGAKLDIAGIVKAAIDFVFSKVDKSKTQHMEGNSASNSGDQSVASNSGSYSVASNSGWKSVASNSGWKSVASNSGKESFAINTGINGKVKAALGCFIACAEWKEINDEWHPECFKSGKVDGKKIKADTWYTVKNGKWVEVDND